MTKHQRPTENVARLDLQHAPPSPERIAHIRRWHIKQATCDTARSVATLNISITAMGEVRTSTVAIEPAHAQVILGELRRVSALLQDFIGSAKPAKNVIGLKRSA